MQRLKQKRGQLPGGRGDSKLIRIPHGLVVLHEGIPVRGQNLVRNPEHIGKQPGFFVELIFFLLAEGATEQFVHHHRGIPQGGVYPEHGLCFVGLIGRIPAKSAGIIIHPALNPAMNVVYRTGVFGGLFQIAVHDGEH